MAIQTKVLPFLASTSTGTQSITGAGFRAKVAFICGGRHTTTGATGTGASTMFGVTDGVRAFYSYGWARDGAVAGDPWAGGGGGETGMRVIQMLYANPSNPSTDHTADFAGFTDDGFDLNWTDASGTAYEFWAYLIGGDDIENVLLFDFDSTDNATVPYTQTFVTGFPPEFLMIFHGANLTVGMSDDTNEGGVATQWLIQADQRNGLSTDRMRTQLNANLVGVYEGIANLSLDNAVEVQWTATHAGRDNDHFWALAINGGDHLVVPKKVDANGSVNIPTTFQPRGILTFGSNLTGGGEAVGGVRPYSYGATDGTTSRTNAAVMDDSGFGAVADAYFSTSHFGMSGLSNAGVPEGTVASPTFNASSVDLTAAAEADGHVVMWIIGDGDPRGRVERQIVRYR